MNRLGIVNGQFKSNKCHLEQVNYLHYLLIRRTYKISCSANWRCINSCKSFHTLPLNQSTPNPHFVAHHGLTTALRSWQP